MEKERYKLYINYDVDVDLFDNGELTVGVFNINTLQNFLNQQDARIKELEEENQQLKEEIKKLSLYSEKYYKLEARIGLEERTVGDVVEELDRLRNQLELLQIENKLLKQSLNQKAIEALRQLRGYFAFEVDDSNSYDIIADYGDILDWISDKIKELRKEQ